MGNEAYQQKKDIDLTPDPITGLINVPKNIVIYLTNDQVEATWQSLCDYAKKHGRVKSSAEIDNFIFVGDTENIITPQSTYGNFSIPEDAQTLEQLNMVPKLNDANRLAQTDKDYKKDDPDYIPDTQNFVKKIWNWYDKNLINQDEYNAIIRGILFSSGSIHNDWVYALTGEDAGREQDAAVLDMHDRRIDDPNVPLTVKGGVNVGDPDNATDRKKLSVFGETELQDGTTFGRLLDTFGEQFPMYFGHLIPDHGQYYKVYINRGEDRYNAEDWDDQTYGTGFGTIEAYKEIVSHTTVNADRGMIIEDGLGDRTDRVIQKTERELDYYYIHLDDVSGEYIREEVTREDIPEGIEPHQVDAPPEPSEETVGYYVVEINNGNSFDPTGALTHQTNGFALSVHHDGAKVQGHTYIQDEGSANLFFKEEETTTTTDSQTGEEIETTVTTIYKANVSAQNGFDIVTDIEKECWFCDPLNEKPSSDWQYVHYCTTKDNFVVPVVDMWYGHLYHEGTREIKGQEGYKYRIYRTDSTTGELTDEYDEYYYSKGVFHLIHIYHNIPKDEIYQLDNNLTLYYIADKDSSEKSVIYKFIGEYTNKKSRADESTKEYPIDYVKDMSIIDGAVKLSYSANIRIIPETDKVYQINATYTETDNLYGLIDQGTYSANTYLYWDGIKFIPVPNRYDDNNNEVYNQKQDYGSLTIGTRAQNNEQDNDTIGRNSLEVGKLNEAVGDNSVAQGDSNYVSAIDGHAEGLHTKVTGEFSHAEGVGIVGKIWKQEAGQHGSYIGYGEEGRITEIKGVASHAEGGVQYIEGVQSHAEGRANKILGYFTDSAHAEGSENEIQDSANYSHAEGELNIIARDSYDAHVEGLGNVVDRNYQHLAGVLANTKHQVDTYYSDDTEIKREKPVIYAIGDGASEKRRPDRINTTDKLRAYWKYENNEWVEYAKLPYSENPIPTEKVSALPTVNIDPDIYYYLYEKGNLFAVTEDGDTYVAGHLEVDGTSDLSDRVTIGDSVANHELALEVLKHSKFDQNVTIERDPTATPNSLEEKLDTQIGWESQNPPIDNSLKVKGKSLFGDTLTIGKSNETYYKYISNTWTVVQPPQDTSALVITIYGYNNLPTGVEIQNNVFYKVLDGTFWGNLDQDLQGSIFTGLNVHGEIKNERIPDNLYTSQVVQGERIFNEFADKFWTNSSIATATATYRGCYTEEDYGPNIDPTDHEAMAHWLDNNVNPFVPGDITNVANYESLPAIGDINTIYHTLNDNKYYQWVWDVGSHTTGDYTEVNATPDNNDYCFVQIEEDAPILPYVLFPDDEAIADPLELEDSEVDGKNIITHRYKYVQILDPVTGEVLNQGWRFEYQLNNSGFTQAQWDAINSGVTSSWKADIENRFTLLKNYVDSAIEHFGDNFVTLNTDQTITGKKKFDQGIAFSNPGYNSWIWLTNSTNKNPYVVHYTLPSNTQFTQYGTTHYTEEELAALSYVKDNFVYTYYKENSQNIPEIQNIKSPKRFLSSDKDHRGIAFGWNKNNQDVYVWLGIKYEASQNVNEFILPTSVQFPAGQTYNTQELAALSYVKDNFIDKTNDYGYIDGQKRFINGIAFGTDNPSGTTTTWTWLKRATNYNYYVPFFTLPSTIQFANNWSGAYNTTQELAALSYVTDNFIDKTSDQGNITGLKRFVNGIAFGADNPNPNLTAWTKLIRPDNYNEHITTFTLPSRNQFANNWSGAYNTTQELAALEYVNNKIASITPQEISGTYITNGGRYSSVVKTYAIRIETDDNIMYIGTFNFDLANNSLLTTRQDATFTLTNTTNLSTLTASYSTTADSIQDFDRYTINNALQGWSWTQHTALATKTMSITFTIVYNK